MQHWFTSDLHFFHRNILKYSNRPFLNVEEMNEGLINNWNSCVKPTDTVYSLGDFAMGKIENIKTVLSRLNGKIIMITGNHDETIIQNKRSLLAEGYVAEIVTEKQCYINNQFIHMYHYGCRVWNKSHHGSWHLYGHSHGNLPPHGKSVDVGVDAPFVLGECVYRPLSFQEIAQFMQRQPIHEKLNRGNNE